MTDFTRPAHSVPQSPKVAYLHLRGRGSTGLAQATVHGELIPNGDVFVALVRRSEAVELAACPELAQWCPECLDEHARQRADRNRVERANDRAVRRKDLGWELEDAVRAGDTDLAKSVLKRIEALDELDHNEWLDIHGEA